RFDSIFCRAESAAAQELEWHDLNLPVHTSDPFIIVALGSNDAGTMGSVTVIVHGITQVGIGVKTMFVIERPELIIDVLRYAFGPKPHIRDQVFVRVIDAAVQYRNDHLLAAL